MTNPEDHSDALIALHDAAITRDGQHILHDISLTLAPRDFITLIGPNGAGKSMLLRALMGLTPLTSGTRRARHGLRLGLVPQHFMADHRLPLDVRRLLALQPAGHRRASAAQLAHIIDETGIGALLARQVASLSGGELQRVLIARALLGEPDVLLLDEPAQQLDIAGQMALYRLLDQLYTTRRMAVVMVSHDLHLVMASTRQVICLYRHICCRGAPHTITRDPAFIDLFGEELAGRLAVYAHQHDHNHSATPAHHQACSHA